MSFNKNKAYNFALSALLLSREVTDTESDKSNEVKVLNTFWKDALTSCLEELDLDSLTEIIPLELLADDLTGPWQYVYKYPNRCAFLRRIQSHVETDTASTFIDKRVQLFQGQKAIYTNHYQAVAECIPNDVALESLTTSAGFAISYKLAWLAAPLITGKGAKALREEIYKLYMLAIEEAREHDKMENYSYRDPIVASEFVAARLS